METDLEGLTTEQLRDLFFVELEKYVELHDRIIALKQELESRDEIL
ncbi:MAG TPA: hypothetical protein VIJ14_08575 [Rhabdochlamydiaceae bacterium]